MRILQYLGEKILGRTTSIIRSLQAPVVTLKTTYKNREVLSFEKTELYMNRLEEEKNKPEDQKRHEKFVRNIKRRASPMEYTITKAKKEVIKPGLYFEGTLKQLIEKYKDINTVFKHCSLGQLSKYREESGKIYRIYKDGTEKLVYDSATGEFFEE